MNITTKSESAKTKETGARQEELKTQLYKQYMDFINQLRTASPQKNIESLNQVVGKHTMEFDKPNVDLFIAFMNEQNRVERELKERGAKSQGKVGQSGRTTAPLSLSVFCEKDAVKQSVKEFVGSLNLDSESNDRERDEMEQMMDR